MDCGSINLLYRSNTEMVDYELYILTAYECMLSDLVHHLHLLPLPPLNGKHHPSNITFLRMMIIRQLALPPLHPQGLFVHEDFQTGSLPMYHRSGRTLKRRGLCKRLIIHYVFIVIIIIPASKYNFIRGS